jgi:hypothetical protein
MKSSFIICLLIITSCQRAKNDHIEISRADSMKNSLIGKWGGLNERTPVWKFSHDSIYYYDQDKSYPYSIIGNDLVINMGEKQPKLKNIAVYKDTLFFYTIISSEKEVYGLTKAFRYK